MRHPVRLAIALLAVGTLASTACSGWRRGDAAAPDAEPLAAPATSPGEPAHDALPPPVLPDAPGGKFGFSHYVFSELDGEIRTTLVEGPRGKQVRCQREDLPCSYLELKALHESGAAIPPELEMTREQLGELVAQLDALSATLARYDSIDAACAEGYEVASEQNPNMGIHMMKEEYLGDRLFDPTKPEMLLFAMEGGEALRKDEMGRCVDGRWTGAPGQRVVGAAFVLPTWHFGEDHPEGFAGPIDNWHVHYWSCVGTRSDLILSREQCAARGGHMVEKAGWMIHAYAEPEFDNQLGVFAMWNSSIWPRVDRAELAARGNAAREQRPEGGAFAQIESFSFGGPIEVVAGEPITFLNADSVPHQVTAGRPGRPSGEFASGTLATGQSFRASLDAPGEYPIFCSHHPFMTGTVVVR